MFYIVRFFNNPGFLDVRGSDDPGFSPEGSFFVRVDNSKRAGEIIYAAPTLEAVWEEVDRLEAVESVLSS